MAERDRIVVVGSGPAGAAAALFARRAGADVLVLEAGSARASLGITVRVRGFTVLKYRKPLKQSAELAPTSDAKTLLYEDLAPGGLSNHWSLAVPRFAREDFADGARAGEEHTWPIGYDDLAPWYDEVEPLLHIAGGRREHAQLPAGKVRDARELPGDWDALAEDAQRIGRTLAPMPYAYGAETGFTMSGTAFNSFTRLLRPELRAGRLAMRFDARVTRLEYARDGKRVTAVMVKDARGGAEERVPCRAVILAASAIRTPELLLASQCAEFPHGLGNDHDLVGRYLHDHPLTKLVIDLGAPISVHPPLYLTRPALDRAPPLYAAACMQWSGTPIMVASARKRHLGKLPWVGYSVFGTMNPTRDDAVTIAQGGASGKRLELHLRHPPAAIQAMEQARDDLMGMFERCGLSPRVRAWDVEPPGESKHFGGSCRMHASPRFGVLDGWGRMHAVRNVVVADSSAFTTGPEKNPVLTSMALAARAADRLARETRAGDL